MASDSDKENGLNSQPLNQPLIDGNSITDLNTDILNLKRKRNNGEDSELIDQLYNLLSEEKKRSTHLSNELSEMRKQLTQLTQNVSDLNDLIKNLQAEKSDLVSKLRDRKKKKAKKTSETPVTNKTTNTTKQVNQKCDESSAAASSSGTNTTKTSTQKAAKEEVISNTEDKNNMSIDMLEDEIRTPQNKETNESSTHEISSESEDNSDSDSDHESEKPKTHEFGENDKINRTNKTPPIDVWTENQLATQLLVARSLPQHSCVFMKINKTKMRILPRNAEIRTQVIKFLDTRKVKYNTYTPADEKMQNILLKGTEIDSSDVIEEALKRNGISPHRIQRLETGYMRKNRIKSNIWQIVLLPKTDIQEVMKIRYVAEWSVKWELMRKPPITQCRRCQRFNHSASNCTLQYRCVKCPDTHEPGKCPMDQSDNKTKPYCVNCKGEHTANNAKLCSAFQKEMAIRAAKKEKKNKNKPNSSTTTAKTSQQQHHEPQPANYAAALKQKSTISERKRVSESSESSSITQIIKENQQSMREMFEKMLANQNNFIQAVLSDNNGRK